ncbi:hypothetical protein FOZ62_019844, partial [Perkinsus olseni]
RTLERALLGWKDVASYQRACRAESLIQWESGRREAIRAWLRRGSERVSFIPSLLRADRSLRLRVFFRLLLTIACRRQQLQNSCSCIVALRERHSKAISVASIVKVWWARQHHRAHLLWRCLITLAERTKRVATRRSQGGRLIRRVMNRRIASWRGLAARRRQARLKLMRIITPD